jgi:pimeloyl-ACP methyl ester carboxylesterase
LHTALHSPAIERLVLYEPVFPIEEELYDKDAMRRIDQLCQAGENEAALILFYKEFVGLSDEEIAAFQASSIWESRVRAAPTIMRESLAEEQYVVDHDLIRSYTVPTLLIIGGASDAFLTRPSEILSDLLPNSTTVVIPGQKHLAMSTAPEQFIQTLLDFLQP